MEIEDDRGNALASQRTDTERRHEGHHGQCMCRIEFAEENLVTNRGPAKFAAKLNVEVVLFEQTEFPGDGERSAVDERNKPKFKRLPVDERHNSETVGL